MRRTRNEEQWRVEMTRLRVRFEAFISLLLAGDEEPIHRSGLGWETETLVEFANWSQGKTTATCKAKLREFRKYGRQHLGVTSQVVPELPTFTDFIKSSKPHARKAVKAKSA